MDVTPDNVRIARGYGFWLQRQHPFDIVDGRKVPVPFWLFGQAVTNKATSVIGGGTVEPPCCQSVLRSGPRFFRYKKKNVQCTAR